MLNLCSAKWTHGCPASTWTVTCDDEIISHASQSCSWLTQTQPMICVQISPSSQSADPESQALVDGAGMQKFSIKERVSPSTDAISDMNGSLLIWWQWRIDGSDVNGITSAADYKRIQKDSHFCPGISQFLGWSLLEFQHIISSILWGVLRLQPSCDTDIFSDFANMM